MNKGDIITTKDGVEAIVDIVVDSGIYISGRGKKFNHPDRLFLTNKMFSDLLTSKEAKITSGDLLLTREDINLFYGKKLGLTNVSIEGLDKIEDDSEFINKVKSGKLERLTKLFYKSEPSYYRLVEAWIPEIGKYIMGENNCPLEEDNIRVVYTPEETLTLYKPVQMIVTKQQIADDFGVDVLNIKLKE